MKWSQDPRLFSLKYEELVRYPEETLHQLALFLGVPFIPLESLLDPGDGGAWNGVQPPGEAPGASHGRHHEELRSWQHNQPFFDGTNQWQEGLTVADKNFVATTAGPRLVELGYAMLGEQWLTGAGNDIAAPLPTALATGSTHDGAEKRPQEQPAEQPAVAVAAAAASPL
jgi:hypothetical protein